MKILLLARTIKSYWASDYVKKRITKFYAPFNGWKLWRVFGGIFSWPLYFLVAFLGFFKSSQFDLVIVTDPRIGIIFGFLKKLFNSDKKLLVHQLILPIDLAGLKKKVLTIAFEKIEAAVVNSSFEKKNLEKRFPQTRFFFVPLHSDLKCFELGSKNFTGKYIFSGGGAERDFATLIKAAKSINFPFLIVTFSAKNLPKISLPKNVTVKFNIPESEYFKLIANSKFVVVPLRKTGRSAGQTTVVQAMSIGKAVVATKVPGLADYIQNGKTGILVNAGETAELTTILRKLLENDSNLLKISTQAFQFAQKNFSYQVYDQRMANVLRELTTV